MGLVTTPAIVLQTFPYSETSLVVRLGTRDLGVQSAIAKGARRPRSAFGAGLSLFSEGRAHLHTREHRELHTLSGFDLERLRVGLTAGLARFAVASALAEVAIRCAPAAPHRAAYEVLHHQLELLGAVPDDAVDWAGLRALWRLVAALGFAPSLDACACDGTAVVGNGAVAFSAPEGGVLCDRCAAGHDVTRLTAADFAHLVLLVAGAEPAPALSSRRAAAHRRLLARFIRHHLGEGRTFAALAGWERGSWTGTSS